MRRAGLSASAELLALYNVYEKRHAYYVLVCHTQRTSLVTPLGCEYHQCLMEPMPIAGYVTEELTSLRYLVQGQIVAI